MFVGASPWAIRLTAVAAFADVARLLVFPLTLRVDYSPAERTLVTSPLDPRFALGLLMPGGCGVGSLRWPGAGAGGWRRSGWGGSRSRCCPVANLVFPVGFLVAERTLYLPSAGLALAVGAWLKDLAPARLRVVVAVLVVGAMRTAWRVPVWRDATTVILSELEDSPRSYDGPARMVGVYLSRREHAKAIEAYRASTAIYDRFPWVYVWGADAAFGLGRPVLADSMLRRLEQLCHRCAYYYRYEASGALARGDTATADSLLARVREFHEP